MFMFCFILHVGPLINCSGVLPENKPVEEKEVFFSIHIWYICDIIYPSSFVYAKLRSSSPKL